jgi:NTE family protein
MAGQQKKVVNLALQGGGAHGAFTWGVLDRLLEEDRLEVEGISATSAGAMNAAMFATGLKSGGREQAKKLLRQFWEKIGNQNLFPTYVNEWVSLFRPSSTITARLIENSPLYLFLDAFTRIFSPYQYNPFDVNPLRDLLCDLIDFEQVCNACEPKLFLNATNVRTGRGKVFMGDEISIDALMASAALPFLFKAVEIDGEAYWDGGYMGNPAIYPLIYNCTSQDVLLVHVNPIERPDIPVTGRAIENRINEISFNSTLLRELRAIEFVSRLIEEGKVSSDQMKDMHIHPIAGDELMRELGVASKIQADWGIIQELYESGYAQMDIFLRNSWDNIGKCNSTDLRAIFA